MGGNILHTHVHTSVAVSTDTHPDSLLKLCTAWPFLHPESLSGSFLDTSFTNIKNDFGGLLWQCNVF